MRTLPTDSITEALKFAQALFPRAELNTRTPHVPRLRSCIDFTERFVEHFRKIRSNL